MTKQYMLYVVTNTLTGKLYVGYTTQQLAHHGYSVRHA